MSRFELSLSPQYVGSWTVSDAIREIFQNAIDQETVDPTNTMFFDYNTQHEILQIGNKSSVLDRRSLLLGESTKRDDDQTIGQFGEGYKLAALVLLRLGRQLTIYNYGAKETWVAKIVKSKRYGADILVFDVDEKYFWQSTPSSDLIFEITGITTEDYETIKASSLYFQTIVESFETPFGYILCDKEQQGNVYVNGLFVSNVANLYYGYDIKPKWLKLDRDRRMIQDFDLQWRTSAMWNDSGREHHVVKLIGLNAPDTKYIRSHMNATITSKISKHALAEFRGNHGIMAVPVSNQVELMQIKATYKDAEPVIVNEAYMKTIEDSDEYSTDHLTVREDAVVELDPHRILKAFYDVHNYQITSYRDMKRDWEKIMERSKTWVDLEDV